MRGLLKLVVMVIPFVILGSIFLFLGTQALPGELTDDGYPLDIFYYAMGAWFIGLSTVLVLGLHLFLFRNIKKRQDFREHGIKGSAQILATEQTGIFINENPQVAFKLLVEVPGRPPHEVLHKEVVQLIHLGAINRGSVVSVYVDPENDKNLQLDL